MGSAKTRIAQSDVIYFGTAPIESAHSTS